MGWGPASPARPSADPAVAPVAMASEEALARIDAGISEELNQKLTDPAYNLRIRGPAPKRKRVVTYTPIARSALTGAKEKPEVDFGANYLVKDWVCGPIYDRKCEVAVAGEAWVKGQANFVPPAPPGRERAAVPAAREFPAASPVLVHEEPLSPPRRLYEPMSARGSRASRSGFSRPSSAQSRPSSAQSRPASAQSRSSAGLSGRPGSAGGRPPRFARPPQLLSQDEGEPSVRYEVATPRRAELPS